MRIARTERFKRAWARLSEVDKKSARKAIENLLVDRRHPGLRVKRIQGTAGVWEARASRSLRISFEVYEGVILLRNIGPHDETLGRP